MKNDKLPQMYLETGFHPSPSAGSFPSGEGSQFSPDKPRYTFDKLLEMSGDQLFDYISMEIGKAEEKLYGPTNAESKLIFLAGDNIRNPKSDNISQSTTADGVGIYKVTPRFRKIPEINEWIGVAGQVLDENGSMASLVSESADLFYNLIRLSTLDSNELHPHMPDYKYIMGQIAGSLGWHDKKQALLLTAMKYHQRFIHAERKDPEEEIKLMEELLRKPKFPADAEAIIPSPTDIQINSTWGLLDNIKADVLLPRRNQLAEAYIDKQNGLVFASW